VRLRSVVHTGVLTVHAALQETAQYHILWRQDSHVSRYQHGQEFMMQDDSKQCLKSV
jgi:hypothetical protein